jgi:signal transduction histidine kinase
MGTDRPMWRSRAWLVATVVLVLLALALATVGVDGPDAGGLVLVVAVVVTVSVLGWALRHTRQQRKRYEDELSAWAAERGSQAERLRIAGDLHDVVSHGLGLITVRAAAARSLIGPAGIAERANALADIEHVSRETTTELRRMLAVLRDPGAAPLRPAETLGDLPAIVEAANAAGLAGTLNIEDLGTVSPGVQLTVCAVVREAVNNTLRHAGRTRARVEIQRDGKAIVVAVHDAGPVDGWQMQPGAGHGLEGLRRRVTVLGGTLHTERDEHGFHLTARIPDQDTS